MGLRNGYPCRSRSQAYYLSWSNTIVFWRARIDLGDYPRDEVPLRKTKRAGNTLMPNCSSRKDVPITLTMQSSAPLDRIRMHGLHSPRFQSLPHAEYRIFVLLSILASSMLIPCETKKPHPVRVFSNSMALTESTKRKFLGDRNQQYKAHHPVDANGSGEIKSVFQYRLLPNPQRTKARELERKNRLYDC